jgi:menaquinone-dependent protoporphyrinogen oxidase
VSTDPVLVAYATERGSTGEIAEAVAETLRDAGLEVDLIHAARVRSLHSYRAVVVGGAIAIGHLHPDAQQLLRRFRDQLNALHLAVFGVGSRTTEPSNLEACRRQLDTALERVPEAQPFAVTVFGGVLDPAELRSPFNPLPAVDARDWFAIRMWAALVASRLDAVPAAV